MLPKELYIKAAAKLYHVLEMDVNDYQLRKARAAVVLFQRGVSLQEIRTRLNIKVKKPKTTVAPLACIAIDCKV